jgi:hypothetical protein
LWYEGLQIQSHAIKLLRSAEKGPKAVLGTFARYFRTRALLIAKAAKYPDVRDYVAAIRYLYPHTPSTC